MSAGQIVQFSEIKTDIGIADLSSYKSTGKFVCTVAGLYHISAVMMSTTNDALYDICKNNGVIFTAFYGKIDRYYKTTTSVIVTILNVGDEITVTTGSSQFIEKFSCFTIVKLN